MRDYLMIYSLTSFMPFREHNMEWSLGSALVQLITLPLSQKKEVLSAINHFCGRYIPNNIVQLSLCTSFPYNNSTKCTNSLAFFLAQIINLVSRAKPFNVFHRFLSINQFGAFCFCMIGIRIFFSCGKATNPSTLMDNELWIIHVIKKIIFYRESIHKSLYTIVVKQILLETLERNR